MRPSSAITLWRLESPRMSAVVPVCCLVSVFIVNHDKGSRLLLSCNSPPSSCVPPLRDSGGRFSVRLSGGVNRQQGGCHRRQGGEHGRGKGHRACRHAQRRGGMCRGGQVKPSTRLKRGHIARARLLAQESIGCRCCSCSCSCSCFCSLLLCIFSFVWPFGVGLEKKKVKAAEFFYMDRFILMAVAGALRLVAFSIDKQVCPADKHLPVKHTPTQKWAFSNAVRVVCCSGVRETSFQHLRQAGGAFSFAMHYQPSPGGLWSSSSGGSSGSSYRTSSASGGSNAVGQRQ